MSDSILTRAEVEHERKSLAELDRKFGGDMKVDCFVAKQSELLNTITQAVELLEDVECSCWYIPPYQRCKQCDARQAFLASYHAAASPPQPEPSPPQK